MVIILFCKKYNNENYEYLQIIHCYQEIKLNTIFCLKTIKRDTIFCLKTIQSCFLLSRKVFGLNKAGYRFTSFKYTQQA